MNRKNSKAPNGTDHAVAVCPRYPEFGAQIADYLKTVGPAYPKTMEQLIARAREFNAPRSDGAGPNPGRWTMFKREVESGGLDEADA